MRLMRGTTLIETAASIVYDEALRGWITPTGVISDPERLLEAHDDVASQRITKLAFRNRFTLAEKAALEIAQLDDPTAPMLQRAQAAALRANQADVAAATFIDLDREDTRAGVQALESAGLLAAGRALAILDAAVQEHERYRA